MKLFISSAFATVLLSQDDVLHLRGLVLVESFTPVTSIRRYCHDNCQFQAAFGFNPMIGAARPMIPSLSRRLNKLSSKNNDKGDEEEASDDRTGMEDAFKNLDALSSLDLSDAAPTAPKLESTSLNIDDLSSILDGPNQNKDDDKIKNTALSEKEAKLYSDMYNELETKGESEIYQNILGEMNPSSSSSKPAYKNIEEAIKTEESVLDNIDGIGIVEEDELTAVELSQDTDEFMKKALEEALAEARSKAPQDPASDPNSILNDEEMMKEINEVFDKANEKLLESIAEIREEQAALSRASADARTESMQDEAQRLVEAEGSVSRLVQKVKKETEEVEKAIAELEQAKDQLNADPLSKAADLKNLGVVKQGAFVAMFLFSMRSVGDLVMIAGPDGGSHVTSGAIQGAIALACAAFFFFF